MRYRSLDEMDKERIRKLFPEELALPIAKGELRGGVACFAGEPAAAAAWRRDKEEDYGELLSLYVLPEARRLGLGSALLSAIVREMRDDKRKGISFRYGDQADRSALTPFFNDRGFETTVTEMPLGRVSLREIRDAFAKKGFDRLPDGGVCVFDLPKPERLEIRKELTALSGEDEDEYDREWPGCYVIRDGKKLRSVVFLREEREGVLSLDHLFHNGNPKELTGLLGAAVKRMLTHYPEDMMIEMLLATQQGEKLYTGLFGEARYGYRMASCRQSFASI
ncbi:MAG: GNAT family N-acetyltransferase [Lachnospiraceae bacterium]|nr:GNAT family N-acetyltransferase [Lachnospiraceae bacterium]